MEEAAFDSTADLSWVGDEAIGAIRIDSLLENQEYRAARPGPLHLQRALWPKPQPVRLKGGQIGAHRDIV